MESFHEALYNICGRSSYLVGSSRINRNWLLCKELQVFRDWTGELLLRLGWRTQNMNRRRAFTLIELLVTIRIICDVACDFVAGGGSGQARIRMDALCQ